MQIVARVMPERERAAGNGLFTSGTSIGALIAPAILLGLATKWGWRLPFVVVGAAGFIWLGAWFWFTWRSDLRATLGRSHVMRIKETLSWRALLHSARFRRAFVVTITVNPALYFSLNWLPLFLSQQRGIHVASRLATVLTCAYLGLDLGNIAGGLLLGRVERRFVALLASSLLLSAAAVPFVPELSGAAVLIVSMNFALGVWVSIYLTMSQEVDANPISTIAGILGASGSLAGALAMWLVGYVTQQWQSFLLPLVGVSVAGVAAAAAVLSYPSLETGTAQPVRALS
jgi:ACS family hexuronate transporter-like MFS transporter